MSIASAWSAKRARPSSSASRRWFLPMLACCLWGSACSTMPPPPEQFPQPPTPLMQEPAKLKPLPGAPGTPVPPQEAARSVVENYSLANEIRETLIALQHWVKQQFEANKGD